MNKMIRSSRPNGPAPAKVELSTQDLLFIDSYLTHFNASRALKEAGYQMKGTAATKHASKILARPHIQEELHKRVAARRSKYAVTLETVVQELATIGFANMADYVKINSQGLPYFDLKELSREQSAAIQELTVDTYIEKGTEIQDGEEVVVEREVKKVKLKLHDKLQALLNLGKHVGLQLPGKNDNEGDFEFSVVIGHHIDGNGNAQTAAKVSVRKTLGLSEAE